jgi:hypothetical protein
VYTNPFFPYFLQIFTIFHISLSINLYFQRAIRKIPPRKHWGLLSNEILSATHRIEIVGKPESFDIGVPTVGRIWGGGGGMASVVAHFRQLPAASGMVCGRSFLTATSCKWEERGVKIFTKSQPMEVHVSIVCLQTVKHLLGATCDAVLTIQSRYLESIKRKNC